jgi:hypothetical protein
MSLPNWWEASRALLENGNCGLLTAWMVLRHFRKRASVRALTDACQYTKRHCVFTIALATCLKMHGVRVSFCTDPDPKIGGFEKRCYARAARLGIVPSPALELSAIALALRRGCIPIVFFNSDSGIGQFSPVLAIVKGKIILPLADEEEMTRRRFLARWSEPEILRQCVIAEI